MSLNIVCGYCDNETFLVTTDKQLLCCSNCGEPHKNEDHEILFASQIRTELINEILARLNRAIRSAQKDKEFFVEEAIDQPVPDAIAKKIKAMYEDYGYFITTHIDKDHDRVFCLRWDGEPS